MAQVHAGESTAEMEKNCCVLSAKIGVLLKCRLVGIEQLSSAGTLPPSPKKRCSRGKALFGCVCGGEFVESAPAAPLCYVIGLRLLCDWYAIGMRLVCDCYVIGT